MALVRSWSVYDPLPYLIRAGKPTGMHNNFIDNNAWRRHNTISHDLCHICDFFKLDFNSGLLGSDPDQISCCLAILAAGAENLDPFHMSLPRSWVLFAATGIRTRTAPFVSRLNRGAGDRAIGTEHAAISFQWPEQFAAPLALVVPLARIGWHDLGLTMATFRTGDRGSKFDIVIYLHRYRACDIRAMAREIIGSAGYIRFFDMQGS
jgi:hypothetical protein